jgi:hypothetical protein
MNALGQDETNGEMGDFCVSCHAPMALREGFVDGGVIAEDTPEHLKGITCYFCHSVKNVTGDNNAEVELANDDIMRGGIIGPIEPSAHGVSFSRFMDRNNPESSKFCGGCHDIVNDKGVHLERTFAEYKETIFAQHGTPNFLSCPTCHMPNREGLAAVDDGLPGDDENVATRSVHSHLWPGVDVALTSWPDREEYEAAVQCTLDDSVSIDMMRTGQGEPDTIVYAIESASGHKMPSGASQDRRMWIEMVGYDADGEVVCSRGVVPDDAATTEPLVQDVPLCPIGDGGPSANDPVQFPLFRDRIFDEDGNETHMFWRAAPSEEFPDGFVSRLMPGPTSVDAQGIPAPHGIAVVYGVFTGLPIERITVRLKMRPMDYDVLEELIDGGYLDESVRDEIPTFTIAGASVDYDLIDGQWVATPAPERTTDCKEVRVCAFDPTAPDCR